MAQSLPVALEQKPAIASIFPGVSLGRGEAMSAVPRSGGRRCAVRSLRCVALMVPSRASRSLRDS